MADFETDPTVILICRRMRRYGIDLSRFWREKEITNTWRQTPMGFRFALTIENYYGLMHTIVESDGFGSDSVWGGSQHVGASYREDSRPDSLHIVMSKKFLLQDVQEFKGQPGCSIHLDSVSVVRGVNKSTRRIEYDTGKLFQHLASDLMHTPLTVPSDRVGLVFGWRL